MKTFLAIDTTASYLTVIAKNKAGQIFTTHLPDCAMNHSVKLLQTVEKTLQDAGMGITDCDFFSCVVGAGSFTGIRIGIACVKGFCTATGKPCLPVTSFDEIAYTTEGAKTLSVISAGHHYCYVCGYNIDKEVVLPPSYRSEAEVQALSNEYTLAGFETMELSGMVHADMAKGLLLAVEAKQNNSENFMPCERLTALYVRKSQAEENRK